MTKGKPMTKHYLYTEHLVDGLATPTISYQFYFAIINVITLLDPRSYFVQHGPAIWNLLMVLEMSSSCTLSLPEVLPFTR